MKKASSFKRNVLTDLSLCSFLHKENINPQTQRGFLSSLSGTYIFDITVNLILVLFIFFERIPWIKTD